jgi:hypothetical protein
MKPKHVRRPVNDELRILYMTLYNYLILFFLLVAVISVIIVRRKAASDLAVGHKRTAVHPLLLNVRRASGVLVGLFSLYLGYHLGSVLCTVLGLALLIKVLIKGVMWLLKKKPHNGA